MNTLEEHVMLKDFYLTLENHIPLLSKSRLSCVNIICDYHSAWPSFLMELPFPKSNDAVSLKASIYVMGTVSAGSR